MGHIVSHSVTSRCRIDPVRLLTPHVAALYWVTALPPTRRQTVQPGRAGARTKVGGRRRIVGCYYPGWPAAVCVRKQTDHSPVRNVDTRGWGGTMLRCVSRLYPAARPAGCELRRWWNAAARAVAVRI